ncbi:Fc.00g111480.m01.CDS01 [Cosmosporella sp. VM-42]
MPTYFSHSHPTIPTSNFLNITLRIPLNISTEYTEVFYPSLGLSPPHPFKMSSWEIFPIELRNMILKEVAGDYCRNSSRGPESMARFATVSSEWQIFFEKKSFRRLVIDDTSNLEKFEEAITPGKKKKRLDYIRHIWLRVKLPEYDCSVCRAPEDATTIVRNNRQFTKLLYKLLSILTEGNGRMFKEGLTLELSAHSPSDYQHIFRDCRLKDDYPFNTEEDLHNEAEYTEYHELRIREIWRTVDPYHGLVPAPPGRRRRFRNNDFQRMRGTTSLALDFGDFEDINNLRRKRWRLPLAKIVRGLVIRWQYPRDIAVTAISRLFRESLRNLETFRHEYRVYNVAEHMLDFGRGTNTCSS